MKQIEKFMKKTYMIHTDSIDSKTIHRLRDLGLTDGKYITVIREYPFNGPVIISFENQQIGIRKSLFFELARIDI